MTIGNKRERPIGLCNNMDEPQNNYAGCKKASNRIHTI